MSGGRRRSTRLEAGKRAREAAPAAAAAAAAEEKQPQPRRREPKRARVVMGGQESARLMRALAQRLFLISQRVETAERREFRVLGSTGNVYRVEVAAQPKCSCPDFRRRRMYCKHLFFTLVRVLKVPHDDPVLAKPRLSPAELRRVFERAPPPRGDVLADAAVRVAYQTATGEEVVADPSDAAAAAAAKAEEGDDDGAGGVPRKEVGADDECGICYELLGSEKLVWCRTSCGNSLHAACWSRWKAHKGAGATCPLCRGGFEPAAAAAAKKGSVAGVRRRGGYMNLASFSSPHGGAGV